MKNRVLVIDDDVDVCHVLTRHLTDEGYEAACFYRADRGLEELSRNKYDLVLLDLKLPDMYGVSVLEKIREIDQQIGVIILTAFPSFDSAIASLRKEISDYIPKPFDIQHLRDSIKKVLYKKALYSHVQSSHIQDVGMRVRELRHQRKLSLDSLAKTTGLSKSFLSELERKKKFPRLDTLRTIARALDVEAKVFFRE